jgi:hypothetical protein
LGVPKGLFSGEGRAITPWGIVVGAAVNDRSVGDLRSGSCHRHPRDECRYGRGSPGEITVSERADRRGTIMFGPAALGTAMLRGASWPGMGRSAPPKFDLIDDVRRVYTPIRETQQSCVRAASA